MIPPLTPEEQSSIHAHLMGFLGADPSEVRRAANLLASHEASHLVYGSSLSLGEAQARTKARMNQIHAMGERIVSHGKKVGKFYHPLRHTQQRK